MSAVSHFRGHLFADLRGSTAFTQRAGNAAGAELVKRFRQMVRDEVGQHQGAEVKTEGDAIYVVFPSASMAVMCGLALVDKAENATADHPDLPIHMGVGIHAGDFNVGTIAPPGVKVLNGTVRGMGFHGVRLQGRGTVVERVTSYGNAGPGIVVGGSVIDSVSTLNGGTGVIALTVRDFSVEFARDPRALSQLSQVIKREEDTTLADKVQAALNRPPGEE